MKYDVYEEAILKTLSYSAVFNYPLSFFQLTTFLVWDKSEDETTDEIINKATVVDEPSFSELVEALKSLLGQHVIENENNRFRVNTGEQFNNWQKQMDHTNSLLYKNRRVFGILNKIPWIKLVGITGSLAAYNAKENDDIDIFIVAEKDRLWITRLLVVLVLKLLNKYPKGEKTEKRFCPNIFVDETALAWPESQQTIYTAHEVLLMQPLINKDNTYFKFMQANKWAFDYLNNFKMQDLELVIETPKILEPKELKAKERMDKIEGLAEWLQKTIMRNKITSEIVSNSFVHFKKKDSSNFVLNSYRVFLNTFLED